MQAKRERHHNAGLPVAPLGYAARSVIFIVLDLMVSRTEEFASFTFDEKVLAFFQFALADFVALA
jgi:hypothetical protein